MAKHVLLITSYVLHLLAVYACYYHHITPLGYVLVIIHCRWNILTSAIFVSISYVYIPNGIYLLLTVSFNG